MQKPFILLPFFLFAQIVFAQDKIAGLYKNGFGAQIKLNSDHTFQYIWRYDLSSSWSQGIWKIENEKDIILEVVEVKDSIKNGKEIKLVLSTDTIASEISAQESTLNFLSGGGQNRALPPKKIKIRNGKLFTYAGNGKIKNRKIKSPISETYRNPWFEKEKN